MPETELREPQQVTERSTVSTPQRQTRTSVSLEFIPWSVLRGEFLELWQPGEHISVLGVTGSGKTTLVLSIIAGRLKEDRKARVIIFLNKRRDDTMQALVDSGRVARISDIEELDYKARSKRVILLWPPYAQPSDAAQTVSPVFKRALDFIMKEGDWYVYIDETQYMIETLKLRAVFDEYWNSARSNGISVIAGGQQPVWVGRGLRTQHSWFFVFHIRDEDDRKEIGKSIGDRRTIPEAIGELQPHEFIIVQSGSGISYTSDVET